MTKEQEQGYFIGKIARNNFIRMTERFKLGDDIEYFCFGSRYTAKISKINYGKPKAIRTPAGLVLRRFISSVKTDKDDTLKSSGNYSTWYDDLIYQGMRGNDYEHLRFLGQELKSFNEFETLKKLVLMGF